MPLGRHLARSTPFRLAIAFTALFVSGLILSGLIVYRQISLDLSERLDESLRQTFTVIAATYQPNDLEDLVAAVESHASLSEDHQQIFALISVDRRLLAGSAVLNDATEGFSTFSAAGIPDGGLFRAFSGHVGQTILTVASSYDETLELEHLLLTGLGWATLITAGFAITAGAMLAARIQRRLDAIASTMANVSHGRLDARIPLLGNGDDIDAVSSQINIALKRLASLVEGMRQVSNDIAHELKTPLNRLHIALEDAACRAAQPELQGQLNEALAETAQLNATFDALLRIAQIETGARKARFQPVDLGALIVKIGEFYADLAADEGRDLTVIQPDGPVIFVSGDADLLSQLFANLIENALRHTPSGTPISLSWARQPGSVVAEIRDGGPGIPETEREKVFQRLYRMDKSRSTPGTGLGLSLVKSIADLHSATITLEDGRPGMTVVLRFPTM